MHPVSRASSALLRTEARLFAREPANSFWIVGFPAVLLVILGCIPSFRHARSALGGERVIDVYVPVCVLLGLLVAGIQAMPQVLTGYRQDGVLRRIALTPVRPAQMLGAQVAVYGAAALASSLLVLVVGRAAFGVALPQQGAGYAVALLLAALVALGFGALVCAVSGTVRTAQALGSVFFFPAMFTAGVWIPVQSMPRAMRHVVDCLPFGACVEALHQAAAGSWPSWTHLGVAAAWILALFALAERVYRRRFGAE